jgi:hypothetical protein
MVEVNFISYCCLYLFLIYGVEVKVGSLLISQAKMFSAAVKNKRGRKKALICNIILGLI